MPKQAPKKGPRKNPLGGVLAGTEVVNRRPKGFGLKKQPAPPVTSAIPATPADVTTPLPVPQNIIDQQEREKKKKLRGIPSTFYAGNADKLG